MNAAEPLVLAADVQLVPVAELDADVRVRIGATAGDVAVNLPHGRSGTKVIDANTAALLRQFGAPRTITDAIISTSDGSGQTPSALLDAAFPVLYDLLRAGVLVPANSIEAAPVIAVIRPGQTLRDWRIVEVVQVLGDVDVYQAIRSDGARAAIKLARNQQESTNADLAGEARLLACLPGDVTPRLLESGDWYGQTFLAMEWRPGLSAYAAVAELRGFPATERSRRMAALCSSIAHAFARLHEEGVVHGDVHGENIVVNADGAVTLLDLGLARSTGERGASGSTQRGAAGYAYEPEFAGALLAKVTPPSASERGEQYLVATLIYELWTGATYLDFALETTPALKQIVEAPPLSFVSRGIAPLPHVERVLFRALAKDPAARFVSMREFCDALDDALAKRPTSKNDSSTLSNRGRKAKAMLRIVGQLELDGTLLREGLRQVPTCSVAFGAAGISYAFYRRAITTDNAQQLALADAWCARAVADMRLTGAFYGEDPEISEASLGASSLYFAEPGVHVVRCLVAHALGDVVGMRSGLRSFVRAASRPCDVLDLNVGQAGLLLGAAMILETLPPDFTDSVRSLRSLGSRLCDSLLLALERGGAVDREPLEWGAAHGMAGMLFAMMRWMRAQRRACPDDVRRGLRVLGEAAHASGRGLRWPWGTEESEQAFMPGWCNGSAGFVPVWLLAHDEWPRDGYADLALGAAWNAWEDGDSEAASLCCGYTGRAYAMLSMYRASGDPEWRRKAITLASEAVKALDDWEFETPSLYKGIVGPALLQSELAAPELARFPMFEADGWVANA